MSASGSISVAMATHEGARWVEEQLASIVGQTRRPDEIVVCDDASSDGTAERVARFARDSDVAIRLERNPARLGTTANFERAVSLCRGEIVFLADQDDVWLPRKVAELSGALERHPEVGLVFCNADVVDDRLKTRGYDLWRALAFTPAERRRLARGRACEVFARHVVAAGTTLAFRSRYRDLVLPFPKLASAHDAWIAFLISAVADCLALDERLVLYRLHDANQIGIKRFNLREQYQQARRQISDGAFDYAVRFFGAARERLLERAADDSRPDARTLDLIDAKIEHSRIRVEMSDSLLRRLRAIAGETARGRYWRFAYGSRSIAQDIWLR